VSGITALAVDLGGSHASCAIVRDGSIVERINLPADGRTCLGDLLPSIAAALRQCLQSAGLGPDRCSAVVLGFCGVVNPREKRVLATNAKFCDATAVDLGEWCAREFSLPFLLENDARLALLGETAYGAAQGFEDAVMITLGSGIGGSAMIHGRLLQSKHGLAGMIGGHFPVSLDGRLCTCGNRGCAESEASTVFLEQIYREHGGSFASAANDGVVGGFAELFRAVDAGEPAAAVVLKHCIRVWSVLSVALIHAYDPEVIVFGGSVMKRAADIIPHVQAYIDAHAWTPGRTVPLRVSVFGSDAALLGAIPLIESSL
jgi:glucokinase